MLRGEEVHVITLGAARIEHAACAPFAGGPVFAARKSQCTLPPPLAKLKLRWPWTVSRCVSQPRAPNFNVDALCFCWSMSLGAWLNIEIGGTGAPWSGTPTEFKFST